MVTMSFSWALLGLSLAGNAVALTTSKLPVVDLGYTLHRAANFNATGKYYNFTNIAYAKPPLGDLRFAAPQAPATDRRVHTGEFAVSCPNAIPDWFALNLPSFSQPGGQSEDCLYLDVFVPEKVFKHKHNKKAPVLVWVHGGGLFLGSKDDDKGAAGLLAAAKARAHSQGIIFVALNYRLGLFGFTGGPTFQNRDKGTENAGLLDQRFALDWVQKYICEFGGDPQDVTVIGESAGAGSLVNHITAYGHSRGDPPFRRAILQSPYLSTTSRTQKENEYKLLLKETKVRSLKQLRALDSKTLQQANIDLIAAAPPGGSRFGGAPSVDGTYVTAPAGQNFLNGGFAKDLEVVVGINLDEGSVFVPEAFLNSTDGFRDFVKVQLLGATPAEVSYVTDVLYPPVGSTDLYTSDFGRFSLFTGEASVWCHETLLSQAYKNKTHVYQFSVPPGYHTQDIAYTFYNGGSPEVSSTPVALTLQGLITQFTLTGAPNGEGLPHIPVYGDRNVLNLTTSGYHLIKDPHAGARCAYLQTGRFG